MRSMDLHSLHTPLLLATNAQHIFEPIFLLLDRYRTRLREDLIFMVCPSKWMVYPRRRTLSPLFN